VVQIIFQLLRRLPWDSRFDALEQAITPGRAIFISAKIVMELAKLSDQQTGEARPQPEALIRRDAQAGLEKLALLKVQNAAADESLLRCPKLPEILALWQALAGDTEPITWVNQVVRDDHNLAILLEKFMEKDFSHSMLQVDGESRYRVNQEVLMPFLDPRGILDRTRTLAASDWLGQPQQDALRQFIKNYELKGC